LSLLKEPSKTQNHEHQSVLAPTAENKKTRDCYAWKNVATAAVHDEMVSELPCGVAPTTKHGSVVAKSKLRVKA
jgi:hypothetical protein